LLTWLGRKASQVRILFLPPFLCFLALQLADGGLTYIGVSRWGIASEGNPLACWWMTHLGISLGLITMKSTALVAAAGLAVVRPRVLWGLSALFSLAVAEWCWIFWLGLAG
jgi:hypothetical protein